MCNIGVKATHVPFKTYFGQYVFLSTCLNPTKDCGIRPVYNSSPTLIRLYGLQIFFVVTDERPSSDETNTTQVCRDHTLQILLEKLHAQLSNATSSFPHS